ncbi:MAG: pantetheine-phosphate adenylyltransferase [Clostridia bacterium]|nr:pantetheine-phosphate adenylyltransferase [Clostridia bacterium]
MLNSKKALISGSFDPPTIGHYDLVMRAARMFDEVYVTEFVNSSKNGFFNAEQRLCMLRSAFKGIPNIHVDSWGGLLVDYAREHGIGTIVKGARSATDFDYEQSMALINRSLEPELDTVIIPTRAEYMHISSTMVRELIRYGCDYTKAVPAGVAELIAEFSKNK